AESFACCGECAGNRTCLQPTVTTCSNDGTQPQSLPGGPRGPFLCKSSLDASGQQRPEHRHVVLRGCRGPQLATGFGSRRRASIARISMLFWVDDCTKDLDSDRC